MTENQISYFIRGAIFKVYNQLGPGLLESAYEKALFHELKKSMTVERQIPVNVLYDGIDMGCGYRMDILVENCVVIEIKSADQLNSIHHKQLLTYLRHSGLRLGILVNFNTDNITQSIHRKVNQLIER